MSERTDAKALVDRLDVAPDNGEIETFVTERLRLARILEKLALRVDELETRLGALEKRS